MANKSTVSYKRLEQVNVSTKIDEVGANPLICFGVNPSTATKEFADKTSHMVEQIAKRNAYDGWIMLNIYPLRSTDPNGLPEKIDSSLPSENIKCITELL